MDTEMAHKDAEVLVEIARMYYEYGLGQQEIAERVGLSRSRISRMLTRAREIGIVQVTVSDPFREESELARELQVRFGLKRAVVCPVPRSSRRPLAWHLGQAAARLLREIVRDNDTIGVTGGTTMLQVARALRPMRRAGVSVVQLEGTLSGKGEALIHGNEIALLFAKAFGATPYFLSVPAIVERRQIKEALVKDRNLSRVLEMGESANVAVFTIGHPDKSSILVQAGYFSPDGMEALVTRGAVGDLCSRFFTEDGSICDEALNQRTIGLDLQEFARKDFSVAVAGGSHKVAGIRGALRGRFMNVLVTDEATAKELLGVQGLG
ncbi:MAG: sugar-binding transcriptional regulator [Bacillota bacterium]